MPHNDKMSIEEKRNLFAIRNRMIRIGNNFGNIEICEICNTEEDMKHIYDDDCNQNKEENKLSYEEIYTGNLYQQIDIFRIFMKNLKERENRRMKINPRDPYFICDPLNIV